MGLETKETLVVAPLPGYEPEIGRLLWMMEANRKLTKEAVENLPAEALDWRPTPDSNSIGSLLYHIAGVELGWLYVEVLEQDFPAEMAAHFPEQELDERGMLPAARGKSLAAHLDTLEAVRQHLRKGFRGMSTADFRRARDLPEYDVTPEWVLYHLLEHEAMHRGEIGHLRGLAAALPS